MKKIPLVILRATAIALWPAVGQAETATAIAQRSADKLRLLAEAMSRGEETTESSDEPEPTYPPIATWSEEELALAVAPPRKSGPFKPIDMVAAILRGEFNRQVPKQAKKDAYLWALNFVESVTDYAEKHGADALTLTPESLRNSIDKGAAKRYPSDPIMQAWFIAFVFDEIRALNQEATETFEGTLIKADALAELHKSWEEWRHTLNTSPEYNDPPAAREVRKALPVEVRKAVAAQ